MASLRDIRATFLDYFGQNEHEVVACSLEVGRHRAADVRDDRHRGHEDAAGDRDRPVAP